MRAWMIVFSLLISGGAHACCDHLENDFDKTVAGLDPFTALVIVGEVTDVRTTRPYRHANEMDVKVISVEKGVWTRDILMARAGWSSATSYFDEYIPGHRYKMAFVRHEEEDGSVYFTQSICGTYVKAIDK